jgi:hypothetical protein
MWEAGRLVQIEAEMIRYKIAVVGISEACWNSFGEMKTANGNTVEEKMSIMTTRKVWLYS